MKAKETVIDCSKCGTYAVAMNGKDCISVKSGNICKGKITSKIKKYKEVLNPIKEFSFDDLEIWGSNSGETGIVINHPEKGNESVCLKHKPSGKIGYVKLNI